MAKTPSKRRIGRRWLLLVIPVLVFGGWSAVNAVSYATSLRLFAIPTASMAPTLAPGDRICVELASRARPKRGEIWVFTSPTGSTFVKRVIGVPGDTVTIDTNGTVNVNGKPLNEPYVYQQLCPCDAKSVTLHKDQYFVLGDHRGDSDDSRDWGAVPRKDIIGKAALVYWPLPDIHLLHDWSGIFTNIP